MKRIDFLKGLGVLPLAFIMPTILRRQSSGIIREKFRNHPNPTDEEFNQDGWYFENGHWEQRLVCIRASHLKNGEITVSKHGTVIKKEWKKPYYENQKGMCVYTYPEFVSTSKIKLPKTARVCYSSWSNRFRVDDAPDLTRAKLIQFTWSTAPMVADGAEIPLIGYFK